MTPLAPPPQRHTPAPIQPRLGRLWDRLSLYLPVVLMGLLALISYWVLRSAPLPEEPTIKRPVTHHPDYFMRGFAVRTFNQDGGLKSEIFGQEARHYPDTDTLEVDRARLRNLGPNDRQTHAKALRLTVNAEQNRYQLQGQVQVTRTAGQTEGGKRPPPMTFASEALVIQTDLNTLSSDQPVVITRGNDRISADNLHYNDTQRLAQLQGRVHTTLAARP